ncbi:MAG: hypothetical protein K6F93_07015 [Lachnospiraceae bacterium]|nr:hypothetical protein [Lachnospiraceae bacterium]
MRKIISQVLFFALFLTGCTSGSFESAAELYAKGEYELAMEAFEKAADENPDDVDVKIGQGFNLAMLGKTREAIDVLYPIYEGSVLDGPQNEKDVDRIYDLGSILIDLYIEEGSPVNAGYVSDQLIFLARNTDEKEKYQLKSAEIYVELYKDNLKYEAAYRKALTDIINLSIYAGDEYVALVNSYRAGGDYKGMLAAADNMIIYMRGRSAHIDNFPAVIGAILDAAEVSGYDEYEKKPQDYYAAAQEFITLAGDKGLTYEQKLRYRIVIAERMHQNDVAIRLLGVYLNHCKDDEKAIKEKAFLEDRF